MSFSNVRQKLSIGTTGLWIILGMTIILMVALIIGNVIPPYDYWVPIIPIGSLLAITIPATIVDLKSQIKKKFGIVGIWTVFGLTTIIMLAFLLGNVFRFDQYWIPITVIGSMFILAIVPTIMEYTAGEVKFCPKCGIIFEKKWDFCQECGTRILMRCPSCKAKVKGNSKYCIKCGVNLSEIELIQLSTNYSKFNTGIYTKSCDQCGAPAKPDSKYCVFCGVSQ
jgi:hypothetical protein